MYKLKLAFYEGTIWYETIVWVCVWMHIDYTSEHVSLMPLWKNYKW